VSWTRLFPFDVIREGQRAFLEDAAAALSAGRILLAHAPTGMGKTAVALAAALRAAGDRDATVFFLTSKHSQHRIAVDTVRRLRDRGVDVGCVDLIAKQAMCLQPTAPRDSGAFEGFCRTLVSTAGCAFYRRESRGVARLLAAEALHVQQAKAFSSEHGVCPHKAALEASAEAAVVVGDYNHLFSEAREGVLARASLTLGRIIAVVDEAHNLPERIRSQGSADLTPRLLERAKREALRLDRRLARSLTELATSLRMALSACGDEEVPPEFLGDLVARACGASPLEFATILELLGAELSGAAGGAAVLQVSEFLHGWLARKGLVRIARGGPEPRLSYRLLDPAAVAGPIFAALRAGLLMSGTLHPVEMYGDLLGIPGTRRVTRRYPSPFDPRRRLLLATREHTSAYASRHPAMYRAIAGTIAAACTGLRGGAAAFLPSYDFAARVAAVLRDRLGRPLLVENPAWTKEDRDAAIQWLERHGDPGGLLVAVLGGSLSEGVDFRGNLLKVVFLVGLPLSPPTVETKALQRHFTAKYGAERGYDYAVLFPAVSKLLQAAGRPIRSEEDRAVIVLMESRLLEPRYRRLFPEDFEYRECGDVPAAVEAFFAPAEVPASEPGRAPEPIPAGEP